MRKVFIPHRWDNGTSRFHTEIRKRQMSQEPHTRCHKMTRLPADPDISPNRERALSPVERRHGELFRYISNHTCFSHLYFLLTLNHIHDSKDRAPAFTPLSLDCFALTSPSAAFSHRLHLFAFIISRNTNTPCSFLKSHSP